MKRTISCFQQKDIELANLPLVKSNGKKGKSLTRKTGRDSSEGWDVFYRGIGYPYSYIDYFAMPEYITTSGKKYRPVMILGSNFRREDFKFKNVLAVAEKLRLKIPPIELVGLIAKIKNGAGLEKCFEQIIVMHDPIKTILEDCNSDATARIGPFRLSLYTDGTGKYIRVVSKKDKLDSDPAQTSFVFIK